MKKNEKKFCGFKKRCNFTSVKQTKTHKMKNLQDLQKSIEKQEKLVDRLNKNYQKHKAIGLSEVGNEYKITQYQSEFTIARTILFALKSTLDEVTKKQEFCDLMMLGSDRV